MTETEKLAAIAALITQMHLGELSSYDFACLVTMAMAG
jgi:hypothetical protein